jgi:hypothetical protein
METYQNKKKKEVENQIEDKLKANKSGKLSEKNL